MSNIWEFGEWVGESGKELKLFRITCPFCSERGNFSFEHQVSKNKPNDSKELHFDTLKCGNCSGYVLVFWAAARNGLLHNFYVLPDLSVVEQAPDEWPEKVGEYWVEAHRSLVNKNWKSAVTMSRSALQACLRDKGASGQNLQSQIDDLAKKGILSPLANDWAHEIRTFGNEVVHPKPNETSPTPQDAQDIIGFLDCLLSYLYTLPEQVKRFRSRRTQ